MTGRNRNAFCSFCRKSYTDVGPLVEGPGDVYICGECIELCQAIIEQEKRRRGNSQSGVASVPVLIDVEKQLGKWFGCQPQAIRDLGTLVRGHYQRQTAGPPSGDLPGANSVALVLGPRRSSKMLLARVLALILNDVPLAEVAANSLREGPANALAPPFFELLEASDFDVELARHGIVYIDGIDDKAVQPLVLEVLDGRRAAKLPRDMHLDVARILFLCGAALPGLDESMARHGRHPEQPVTNEDLIRHGLLPELAHRFSVIVTMPPLDEATLVRMVPGVQLKGIPENT